ncbi:MAG: NUDIX hydrolase [bacterium]|nr:NUDIX hydrolase [bacterium]
MKGNFSVAIMVMAPGGLILVMDPFKSKPLWKFPGGHGWASESPAEAAVRELEEETGIALSPYELELFFGEKRKNNGQEGDHDFFLFYVFLSDLPQLKIRGNEGEKIGIFPFSFICGPNFLPDHRRAIMSSINMESPVS